MSIEKFEQSSPSIAADVFIHESALVIGDVTIAEESSIWPFTVVRGDVNKIRIGARTNIQDNSVLHVTHDGPYKPGGYGLSIGSNVTVGHRVILHGCQVEDDCLIGMGSIVMDGAILQRHVLLGAGSLVTPNKVLEGGYLWMGQPAQRIRPLTSEEIESLSYSAQHYVRLARRHRV